jgi:hypothetical protein
MARVGVSESWLTTLGILKAAAIGLVLFFIAAIITHLRGRDYSFGLAIVFLLLALAALVLQVASL